MQRGRAKTGTRSGNIVYLTQSSNDVSSFTSKTARRTMLSAQSGVTFTIFQSLENNQVSIINNNWSKSTHRTRLYLFSVAVLMVRFHVSCSQETVENSERFNNWLSGRPKSRLKVCSEFSGTANYRLNFRGELSRKANCRSKVHAVVNNRCRKNSEKYRRIIAWSEIT